MTSAVAAVYTGPETAQPETDDMAEWQDITQYQHGGNEHALPTTWRAVSGRLRVVITCGHIFAPGEWVMHCPNFQIDTHHLDGASSLADAKRMAVEVVRNKAKKLAQDARALSVD